MLYCHYCDYFTHVFDTHDNHSCSRQLCQYANYLFGSPNLEDMDEYPCNMFLCDQPASTEKGIRNEQLQES